METAAGWRWAWTRVGASALGSRGGGTRSRRPTGGVESDERGGTTAGLKEVAVRWLDRTGAEARGRPGRGGAGDNDLTFSQWCGVLREAPAVEEAVVWRSGPHRAAGGLGPSA
jgi:hypothetical protein